MKVVIAHRSVAGVYLCQEGLQPFWGPREYAKEYSTDMVQTLLLSYPRWEYFLGVSQDEARIEIDRTPETLAPLPG